MSITELEFKCHVFYFDTWNCGLLATILAMILTQTIGNNHLLLQVHVQAIYCVRLLLWSQIRDWNTGLVTFLLTTTQFINSEFKIIKTARASPPPPPSTPSHLPFLWYSIKSQAGSRSQNFSSTSNCFRSLWNFQVKKINIQLHVQKSSSPLFLF